MSIAARLAELTPATPRVLVIDIETSPHLAWTFSTWRTTISPDMIVEPSRILCLAAGWADEERITAHAEWDAGGHSAMVAEAWRLLDEASVVVTYNGPGFDEKHLQREFLTAGYGPPSPWVSVDLLRVIRSQFKFPSHRLGKVTESLDIGSKLATEGWPLWRAVLEGDESARGKFVRYCRQDVRITRDLLRVLGPWVKGMPHAGLWTGDMAICHACGSSDLSPAGVAYAKSTAYLRLWCRCGAWSKVLRNGETRPA